MKAIILHSHRQAALLTNATTQLSIILFSFLAVVNCLTVPPRSPSTNDTLITADELAAVPALVKRDDEWTMVLYNEHKKGSQCGGTSSAKSGDSDQCLDITSKKCVDLSVKRDLGIADCTFNFRLEKECKGGLSKSVTVGAGDDSNGVDLADDVKFVSVSCGLGGLGGAVSVVEIAV